MGWHDHRGACEPKKEPIIKDFNAEDYEKLIQQLTEMGFENADKLNIRNEARHTHAVVISTKVSEEYVYLMSLLMSFKTINNTSNIIMLINSFINGNNTAIEFDNLKFKIEIDDNITKIVEPS